MNPETTAWSRGSEMLCSRLHQRGRVVGRGLDSVSVCFPGNQVLSVAPQLLRVLDDAGGD